ncbi:TPA: hypothetical protein JS206_001689 [Escherichia coli]|nr:hypothetical protein [Escherichia coli]
MKRKHWTHRMPRAAAKWALVAILVPFFLVGCVSLDKARQRPESMKFCVCSYSIK